MTKTNNDQFFETTDYMNDQSDFKKGDTVKMYKEASKFEFPCLVLYCDQLEEFRALAMKGILATNNVESDNAIVYNVYVHLNGDAIKVAGLPNTRLKFILSNEVFGVFDKKIFIDEQTMYEGDMLYALCQV